jgi:hypothetical protein
MRKIEIKNQRLLKSLTKKQEIIEELNKLEKEADELRERGKQIEEEVNKYLGKIQREDELSRPEVKREMEKVDLDEFEDLSKCYLEQEGEDKGKLFLVISDRLEEFKTYYKEQNEKNNSSDTNNNDSGNDTENTPEGEDDSSRGQEEEGGELGEE